MKKVRVTGNGIDTIVLVSWENILAEDCPDLQLTRGRDLSIFYRNNKDKYKFEPLVYYDKPYTPNEKLEYLREKNPVVDNLIDRFSLILTI